jgi:putative aldouronate transport system substrate-binding protein
MANAGVTKELETADEFYIMMKAFTLNNPNKNGKADTYGLTSASLNLPCLQCIKVIFYILLILNF